VHLRRFSIFFLPSLSFVAYQSFSDRQALRINPPSSIPSYRVPTASLPESFSRSLERLLEFSPETNNDFFSVGFNFFNSWFSTQAKCLSERLIPSASPLSGSSENLPLCGKEPPTFRRSPLTVANLSQDHKPVPPYHTEVFVILFIPLMISLAAHCICRVDTLCQLYSALKTLLLASLNQPDYRFWSGPSLPPREFPPHRHDTVCHRLQSGSSRSFFGLRCGVFLRPVLLSQERVRDDPSPPPAIPLPISFLDFLTLSPIPSSSRSFRSPPQSAVSFYLGHLLLRPRRDHNLPGSQ